MKDKIKLLHLKCSFSKLTKENQHYLLGLVEGLKHAQGRTEALFFMKNEVKKFQDCNANDA